MVYTNEIHWIVGATLNPLSVRVSVILKSLPSDGVTSAWAKLVPADVSFV